MQKAEVMDGDHELAFKKRWRYVLDMEDIQCVCVCFLRQVEWNPDQWMIGRKLFDYDFFVRDKISIEGMLNIDPIKNVVILLVDFFQVY